MPLLKRSTFSLLEPPENFDPNEDVFQIRFTKEIFRDYQEYLNRLNLYRQKVWSCELSGKSNLTYEEALVCTLSFTDLLEEVYSSLRLDLSEGLELHAKKDGSEAACKILEVIGSGGTKLYEVGWLGQDNEVINTSVVKADDLICKKAPASHSKSIMAHRIMKVCTKGGNDLQMEKMPEKSSRKRKHLENEMEQQSLRPSHLGKDRLYNRYWFFRHEGRLFVESADSKEWGYYGTKEEVILDALLGTLNIKGIRERALKRQLTKSYNKISNALEERSKDVKQKTLLEEADLRRSTRVQAQPKDDDPSMSFLKYINQWKQ
nr:unnamed protein product [Digitaria exilis]